MVCRELTKTHEEIVRGTLGELAEWAADGVLGEITVVLAGATPTADPDSLVADVIRLVDDGMRVKDACAQVIAANPGVAVASRALRCGSARAQLSPLEGVEPMGLPALVLVHGGGHAADCWELTVDEIHRREPGLTVLAVDLPGRRSRPGDLRALTIADWVDSVVRDIEASGLDDIVITAHSLGGMTVPGVAAKLGASRVREMVFAAAYIPPEGGSVIDTIPGLAGLFARRRAPAGPGATPRWFATYAYTNGMSRAQRRLSLDRLCDESTSIIREQVSRADMPADVPRTWILTKGDRALAPKTQRKSIEALGGVQMMIEIDTCHNLMISEPTRTAEILVERCRRYDR